MRQRSEQLPWLTFKECLPAQPGYYIVMGRGARSFKGNSVCVWELSMIPANMEALGGFMLAYYRAFLPMQFGHKLEAEAYIERMFRVSAEK